MKREQRNGKYYKIENVVMTALISLLCACSGCADTITGKVVAVVDGDTIDVMHAGKAERIRLAGIDAPEKKQAFGTKAKEYTASLVAGQTVNVDVTGKDRYNRTLGKAYLNGTNVNTAIVAAGFAWHYIQYSKDDEIAKAEKAARKSKAGLWIQPNPLPPWDFRKLEKKK